MAIKENTETFLFDWFEECEKENIILSFHGDFNQDLVNAILELSDGGQDVQNSATLVRVRLFSTMVECMQNIRKYGISKRENSDLKPGIIIVCLNNDKYSLITGNLMSAKEVPLLKQRLEKIKSLGKEELKVVYKKTLAETQLSEKSGAGLGLLSIARKCDDINFKFKQIDENVVFYELNVNISSNT